MHAGRDNHTAVTLQRPRLNGLKLRTEEKRRNANISRLSVSAFLDQLLNDCNVPVLSDEELEKKMKQLEKGARNIGS